MCIRDRGNTERYYNNNRVSRPRVNFIRAKEEETGRGDIPISKGTVSTSMIIGGEAENVMVLDTINIDEAPV